MESKRLIRGGTKWGSQLLIRFPFVIVCRVSILCLLIRDWLDPIYSLLSLVWMLLSRVMKVSPAPASSVAWHWHVFCADGSEYCLLDHLPALETPGPWWSVTWTGPSSAWAGSILQGAAAGLITPELVRIQSDGHLQTRGDHWTRVRSQMVRGNVTSRSRGTRSVGAGGWVQSLGPWDKTRGIVSSSQNGLRGPRSHLEWQWIISHYFIQC